jgi:hypothetical protein
MQRQASPRTRRDGWTAERQLRFLDTLARTRSVTRAAAAAGLSRKSAYRLRARADGALFAAIWDRALRAPLDTAKVTAQGDSHLPATGKNNENPPKVTKWRKWRDPWFDGFAVQLRDLCMHDPQAVSSMTLDGPAGPPKFTA